MVVSPAIHLGQVPDSATLDALADFVCGDDTERFPVYRSSSYLTRFFQAVNVSAVHDGTTRKWWVLGVLQQLDPTQIEKVILRLVLLCYSRRGKRMSWLRSTGWWQVRQRLSQHLRTGWRSSTVWGSVRPAAGLSGIGARG
jgi:hypothetical protein